MSIRSITFSAPKIGTIQVHMVGKWSFRSYTPIPLGTLGQFQQPLGAIGYVYKLNIHKEDPTLYNFVNRDYFGIVNVDGSMISQVLSEPIDSVKDVKRFLML